MTERPNSLHHIDISAILWGHSSSVWHVRLAHRSCHTIQLDLPICTIANSYINAEEFFFFELCNEHSLSLILVPREKVKIKSQPRNLSAIEPTRLRNHSILHRLEISSFIQIIITCCMNSRESRLDFWKPIDMNYYLTKIICPSPIARLDQIKPYFKF